MALVKDYFEKTKEYQSIYGKKTLVLMQVGAFFEVYGLQNKKTGEIAGSPIVEFSRICDMNIADKKICVGQDGVLMAGFGHFMLEKYLNKLKDAGYTVVVFVQDEQAKNTTRSLAGIYSPGTYFPMDSEISGSGFNSGISNNTCCIWLHVSASANSLFKKTAQSGQKMIHVGAANINIYTGKSALFEYQETFFMNPTTFDELERFVSIYQPSEAILIGNLSLAELEEILSLANLHCSAIHCISLLEKESGTSAEQRKRAQNSEKQTYQRELLSRFFNQITNMDVFYESFYQQTMATQAYCFLLDFIYQHNPNLTQKISEPIFENCSDRLILANHSLKQLNIIEDVQGTGSRYSSVEKILNVCITAMGRRHFSHHFLNPTTNIAMLEKEYAITEHAIEHYSQYESWRQTMHSIKDLSRLNRHIIMKKITPKALFQFHKNLKFVTDAFSFLNEDRVFSEYLQNTVFHYSRVSEYTKLFTEFLERNFCLEDCEDLESVQTVEREKSWIQRGVDKELDEKTRSYVEAMDQLESIRMYLNSCLANYEKTAKTTDYVKLHETEKNNFKLIATKRRCTILKQYFSSLTTNQETIKLSYQSSYDQQEKEFVLELSSQQPFFFHAQTASNDIITNPQIEILCKIVTNVKLQMKEMIQRVYLQLLNQLAEYQDAMETIIQFVTMIDVVLTKATIAKKYNYCKPVVRAAEKSFVDARGLRHCLIEHLQQQEVYVTNDICLGREDNEEKCGCDGILLYGTNAVGKTSLIRALGIAVVMAQSGLYVPCNQFIFSPYKYIFTRILGNDNIFKGLSTFAVEMSELRTILRLADKQSLVLGDELCSGTESISAQSIFVAGIKQLFQKESSFIFATHLHEIVHYEEIKEMPTVHLKHMAVVFDREQNRLIYDRKLRDGPGDNMYGLEVCRSLNLPEDFLALANEIRMKYHRESQSILSLQTSRYNRKKIVGKCEMCKEVMGTEVHHIRPQQDADVDGFIRNGSVSGFHKNHLGNLMTVCEGCHHKFHSSSLQ